MIGLRRFWQHFAGETIDRIETESRERPGSPSKPIWVLVVASIALTGQNFTHQFLPSVDDDGDRLVRWAAYTAGWYILPAWIVIRLVFRQRLRDYGVKFAGWSDGWPIYLVFVAVMVPLVLVMSGEKHFQQAYPFYRSWRPDVGWQKLVAWEIAYAVQFIALEFFFRGFIVHGLKPRFGLHSIFAMTLPYCMIHFQKPLPECAASIIAGIALGFMSLKTRSIWLGAALHISVAWGMDACSLWRRGLLSL